MQTGMLPSLGRQAERAGHARRGLAAEELEVLGGDGAVAGAQLHGRAHARALDRLEVDAAGRADRVGDRGDAGNRRLQHAQRAGRDVAAASAAVAIGGHAQQRARGRDARRTAASCRRASAPRARARSCRRRRRARSARSSGPLSANDSRCSHLRPLAAVGIEHLEVLGRRGLEHRRVEQPEAAAPASRRSPRASPTGAGEECGGRDHGADRRRP